ncbi:MAG: RNA methyltransferase [Zymomonas mobilis subsp. pomaceae]|uniref:tRNA/rRNA methyltransferase (SpoU) n=1 Tax=Zymomonas mobilis subsp. pomaceae (strain ATCC 29192 / DSM 22645 / JCM 10191 / CCUG 17912 / NBRC 13757 / NCIMB 11200 / NRRL B-4491 / Barker I) TaxID=579138 RepID=F8ESV4_ZYMMT|nr:RNA methyltransferase [Zymomonas mobilis]AEI36920.1 tRNA/rRNA methyltransferase (SpoU) [Zymomonas mobilis subsp. pomaceae ATCC 29192]MDX5948293.1 RNA methyltransferase [Zymomonas mobilis subsp. pomaceae]GEB89047.1 RNA methyltransferase [Zymomonas mobilis subsp. pomaceae]
MPRSITAFSNPLIKRIRALRDKKHRREEGLFLAEGLRILTEAREAGYIPVYIFFAADSAPHPLVKTLIEAVEETGGEAIETSRDILHKLSGKDNPQTVIGVFEAFTQSLSDIDRHQAPIWLVAQSLRDPGNLGTLLRTGDAVGAGGLILIDDCVDPFSVEAVRATMGALFTQKIVTARWEDFILWLKQDKGELIGASLRASQDYQQPIYRTPSFVLVGNEAQGLPATYEDACDHLVKIPMMGRADSLNVAVAGAIMAYEVLNQQRKSG